jgi:hypothetical protein
MKKRVRLFLKEKLKDKFKASVVTSVKNGEAHFSYRIKSSLVLEFETWARDQIAQVFIR